MWGYSPGEGHSRDPRCPWIQGRAETMVTHLRNCGKQPDGVHQQAEQQAVSHGWIQASSGMVMQPLQATIPLAPQPAITVQMPGHPGITQSSHTPLTPFLPSLQLSSFGNPSSSLVLPVIDPALISPIGGLGLPYSLSPSSGCVSPVPSSILIPSAPTSHSGTPVMESLPLPPALKRRRLSSQCLPSGTPPPASGSVMQWSSAQQDRFEHHMANITASCGFPFHWVENPAVRDFLDDFFPHTSHLSSYQLTNRVIPQQVNRYQQAAKDASRGCEGTLQTDGWTGVNFHHLVAFMVTTVRRKVSNIYYCTCKRAEDYLSICRPILLGLWMSLLIGELLSI